MALIAILTPLDLSHAGIKLKPDSSVANFL